MVLKDAELDATGSSSSVEYEESPQATETEAVEDVPEVENFECVSRFFYLLFFISHYWNFLLKKYIVWHKESKRSSLIDCER